MYHVQGSGCVLFMDQGVCCLGISLCAVQGSGCVLFMDQGVCCAVIRVCAVQGSGCVLFMDQGVCCAGIRVCAVQGSGCVLCRDQVVCCTGISPGPQTFEFPPYRNSHLPGTTRSQQVHLPEPLPSLKAGQRNPHYRKVETGDSSIAIQKAINIKDCSSLCSLNILGVL